MSFFRIFPKTHLVQDEFDPSRHIQLITIVMSFFVHIVRKTHSKKIIDDGMSALNHHKLIAYTKKLIFDG